MNKRAVVGILMGAVLGVLCIFGARFRMGDQADGLFLFATWFNRVVIGMMIGFYTPVSNRIIHSALRGAVLGLVVGFSFYVATNFLDLTGFIAGIFYGVIIDIACTRYGTRGKVSCTDSL